MVQVNNRPEGRPSARESETSVNEAPACCASGLQKLLSPRLFKALADPKRLSLFVRLADEGRPCTVGQLAEGSGVDLSVVSRHLATLREAGIIRCEKQGKEVWCSVRAGAVARILRDLADALETCCPDGDCASTSSEASTPPAARRTAPSQA
jgi:DNA-binding transcriptional ArsR family regulator